MTRFSREGGHRSPPTPACNLGAIRNLSNAKFMRFLLLSVTRTTPLWCHSIGSFHDVWMSHHRKWPSTFSFHADGPLPDGVVRVQEHSWVVVSVFSSSPRKKYGKVFSMKIGSHKFVMASSSEAVQEMLVKKSADYAIWMRYLVNEVPLSKIVLICPWFTQPS